MSDKPISVGDLVQIVRANHCGCDQAVGRIFVVARFDRSPRKNVCNWCGSVYGPEDQAQSEGRNRSQVWRLRRIPPLSDLTGTSEDARKPVKETA